MAQEAVPTPENQAPAPQVAVASTPEAATTEAKQAVAAAVTPGIKTEKPNEMLSSSDKLLGMLGYVSFFCIMPIIMRPNSKFCQIHGKQGMIITLFFLLAGFLGIIHSMFAVLLHLIHVIIALLGVMNAAQGRIIRFPMIGEMAQKIDFGK